MAFFLLSFGHLFPNFINDLDPGKDPLLCFSFSKMTGIQLLSRTAFFCLE